MNLHVNSHTGLLATRLDRAGPEPGESIGPDHKAGRDAVSIQQLEARHAAEYLTTRRTDPITKNPQAGNIKSAEAEKSWQLKESRARLT